MGNVSRRTFIRTAVAAGTTAWFANQANITLAQSPSGHQVFQHGVASGDPLATSVILWTRVTPTPDALPGSGRGENVDVHWEIAPDPSFSTIVAQGLTATSVETDHTVHIDPYGLKPATVYYYRFRALGQISPVGRTQTTPAPTSKVDQFRCAIASCASWESGFFAAYRDIAERAQRGELDVVVHLGDYIYEYGTGEKSGKLGPLRTHQPEWETVTLADYRLRYGTYRTDPHLQAAHAAVPWVVTWDDHEIANNAYAGGAENHDPSEGPWDQRRKAAMQAYFEWQPLRATNPSQGGHLYRRLQFGTLAELVMLDLRTYRAAPGTLQLLKANRSPDVVGEEQFSWLTKQVENSTTNWRLIGNSVMLAKMDIIALPYQVQSALQEMIGSPITTPVLSDQWDGYVNDRDRLLEILADAGGHTVFFTGDIHSEWGNEIMHKDRLVAAELVCTSISAPNVDDMLKLHENNPISQHSATQIRAANSHVRHIELDAHGYSIATVTVDGVDMMWLRVADKAVAESEVFVAHTLRYDGTQLR
ncbi:phosphodiesterase/alkaline phosphatase D [Corynebacterium mustelae]|uniref:Phosphodiesterase/alkaline phosphatase D n=1 Tax=Corynebacterium mustelae TaxID=571915 RepID=A0A0G3H0I3_9CORY|nr:alkaline phosphatase D family protein [Corynebacterium mustelae]AKK06260.1 phosphodiesterase/alkaline phosphatase D [Corynebacterium mustelae]